MLLKLADLHWLTHKSKNYFFPHLFIQNSLHSSKHIHQLFHLNHHIPLHISKVKWQEIKTGFQTRKSQHTGIALLSQSIPFLLPPVPPMHGTCRKQAAVGNTTVHSTIILHHDYLPKIFEQHTQITATTELMGESSPSVAYGLKYDNPSPPQTYFAKLGIDLMTGFWNQYWSRASVR